MARKDEIFKSFLNNELLEIKYKIKKDELPTTLREGLSSDKPIVKAIALIVDSLERSPQVTDNELRTSILQFLNTAI
jgi:hypothetical protein